MLLILGTLKDCEAETRQGSEFTNYHLYIEESPRYVRDLEVFETVYKDLVGRKGEFVAVQCYEKKITPRNKAVAPFTKLMGRAVIKLDQLLDPEALVSNSADAVAA